MDSKHNHRGRKPASTRKCLRQSHVHETVLLKINMYNTFWVICLFNSSSFDPVWIPWPSQHKNVLGPNGPGITWQYLKWLRQFGIFSGTSGLNADDILQTSFLMAILQELPLISGDMILSEKPVYAAQQPWIFSASVRQNIIFGSPFDEGKYRRVIKAAVLNKVSNLTT